MENSSLPLEGIKCILESTKSEYFALEQEKNGLNTRVGILIALMTALISILFVQNEIDLSNMFQTSLIKAHFTVLFGGALFVCFFCALMAYIRVFLARKHWMFHYPLFTSFSPDTLRDLNDAELVMAIYQDYAQCIDLNKKQFEEAVKCFQKGNKWLIGMIICCISLLIIGLI